MTQIDISVSQEVPGLPIAHIGATDSGSCTKSVAYVEISEQNVLRSHEDTLRHTPNALYCGDNLDVLRRCIPDESVDLIYLDPPFKSDQNFNLFFKSKDGSRSVSQIRAFDDTWTWGIEADKSLDAVQKRGGGLGTLIPLFRALFPDSDMLAYVGMMAPRLVEMQRVLRSDGSIYLHCDPTASHYLKALMDAVFGPENFQNEIIWKRTTTKNDYVQGATNWPRVHDVLLYYAKDSRKARFKQPFAPLSEEYKRSHYRSVDEDGRNYQLTDLTAPGSGSRGHPQYEFMGVTRYWRYNKQKMEQLLADGRIVQPRPGAVPRYKRYLDEMKGVAIGDMWWDIFPVNSQAHERLPYPTQKPQSLLERIIEASSAPGDVVLDPFCGCGTAIEAADRLERRWIGVDITIHAMRVIRDERLAKLGDRVAGSYRVVYRPADMEAAAAFAAEQPFGFQDWAIEKLGGIPTKARSGDHGVDGRLYFQDGDDGPLRQIIVSVKGGKLKAPNVRELQGAVSKQRAALGILVTLHEPSRQMRSDMASGVYSCASGTYPITQFVTVADILEGRTLDLPPICKMDETKKRAAAAVLDGQMRLPGVG